MLRVVVFTFVAIISTNGIVNGQEQNQAGGPVSKSAAELEYEKQVRISKREQKRFERAAKIERMREAFSRRKSERFALDAQRREATANANAARLNALLSYGNAHHGLHSQGFQFSGVDGSNRGGGSNPIIMGNFGSFGNNGFKSGSKFHSQKKTGNSTNRGSFKTETKKFQTKANQTLKSAFTPQKNFSKYNKKLW